MSDGERKFTGEFGAYLIDAQQRGTLGRLVRRLLRSLWIKTFVTVLAGFVTLWAFIGGAIWTNQHLGDRACAIYLMVGVAALAASLVVFIANRMDH